MKLFETVRANVTTRKAAEYYGIKVQRNGMACCPFHNDSHPSMKLDERFHCFGCQADGDAVNFVERMFGLNSYEAAKKLAEDFHLEYDGKKKNVSHLRITEKGTMVRIKTKEQRIHALEEKMEIWFKHASDVLIRYRDWLLFWKDFYKPEEKDTEWNPLFLEALEQKDLIEYYLDIISLGSDEERLDFSSR